MLQEYQEKGTNLIGGSTCNELVAEVRLMLGSGLVLSAIRINVARDLWQGKGYLVVRLSMFVIVAEPRHGDDVCMESSGVQIISRGLMMRGISCRFI
jgi:hypothetical protein